MVKYELIMRDISQRIASGLWTEGMLMPTENELCNIYGVSRITVRRALDELERAGEITRVQGKGTFIKHKPLASGASHKGFKSAMADQGLIITSRLISREIVQAPLWVQEKLILKNGDNRVWHFVRIRKTGDTPIAYMETYVSKELGDQMIEYNLSEESFYALYGKIFGCPVADTSGYVTAVNTTGWTAKHLGLKDNDASILFKSVAYLEDGRPVQVDYSYFNPKSYQFSYNLNRGNNFSATPEEEKEH